MTPKSYGLGDFASLAEDAATLLEAWREYFWNPTADASELLDATQDLVNEIGKARRNVAIDEVKC